MKHKAHLILLFAAFGACSAFADQFVPIIPSVKVNPGEGISIWNYGASAAANQRILAVNKNDFAPDGNVSPWRVRIDLDSTQQWESHAQSWSVQGDIQGLLWGGSFDAGGNSHSESESLDCVYRITVSKDNDELLPLDGKTPTPFERHFVDDVHKQVLRLGAKAAHQAIIAAYGTHVVVGYRSITGVKAELRYHFESASDASAFASQASGHYSGPGAVAHAAADFSNAAQQMAHKVRVQASLESGTLPPKLKIMEIADPRQFNEFINSLVSELTSDAGKETISSRAYYIVKDLISLPGYRQELLSDQGGILQPFDEDNDALLDFARQCQVVRRWNRWLAGLSCPDPRIDWLNSEGRKLYSAALEHSLSLRDKLREIITTYKNDGIGFNPTSPAVKAVAGEVTAFEREVFALPCPKIYVLAWFQPNNDHPIYDALGLVDLGENRYLNVQRVAMSGETRTIGPLKQIRFDVDYRRGSGPQYLPLAYGQEGIALEIEALGRQGEPGTPGFHAWLSATYSPTNAGIQKWQDHKAAFRATNLFTDATKLFDSGTPTDHCYACFKIAQLEDEVTDIGSQISWMLVLQLPQPGINEPEDRTIVKHNGASSPSF